METTSVLIFYEFGPISGRKFNMDTEVRFKFLKYASNSYAF